LFGMKYFLCLNLLSINFFTATWDCSLHCSKAAAQYHYKVKEKIKLPKIEQL